MKIGVIDASSGATTRDGFTGLRAAMASGDLPATVVGRCYQAVALATGDIDDCAKAGGDSHGLSVAATVMDVAPDAGLYISNPSTWGDLQRSVEWMRNQGVGVIVYAASWSYHGAADGTTPVNPSPLNTVKWAADNGIVWVNSAGNYNGKTWFGAFTDADNDNIHEWAAGDEYQEFTLDAGQTKPAVFMRWDDAWGTSSKDLALLVVENPGTAQEQVVDNLNDEQKGGPNSYPYEFKEFTAPHAGTYAFVVKKVSGAAPGWIQMGTFGSLAHTTSGHSMFSPADSPHTGMLAVGAASTASSDIRSYSSLGPTPDGRTKPDIVGADGYVAVSTHISSRVIFSFAQFGTSYAAPHVAGLAALVRQQNPAFTPAKTAEYLKTHAVPRGNPYPNNTWGHGFAQLPPLGCVDHLDGDSTVSGTWTANCTSAVHTQKSSRHYTFTIPQQSTVTIDLSSSVDGYLYLRNGYNNQKGAALHTDDNSGTGADARISESLAPGTYTIEATTAATGQTGAFTLAASGGLLAVSEMSIAPGADIAEGNNATFTVTADPAPPAALDVTVAVTATGDFGVSPGSQTVTIPTSGSATIAVATTDDGIDEADGTVTATINEDSGYTMSAAAGSATIAVADNDAPEVSIAAGGGVTEGGDAVFTVTAAPVPAAALPVSVAITNVGDFGVTPRSQTVTIPTSGSATLSVATTRDSVKEADGSVTATLSTGTDYTVSASASAASVSVKDATPADSCFEHLTVDGTSTGSWSSACLSDERRKPNTRFFTARFYAFELTERSTVTIELKSRRDTRLYLRRGKDVWRGQALHQNQFGGPGIYDALIREPLPAGWYTIEAATAFRARIGSFTLDVSGIGTVAATPKVSIAAGADVTEGGGATFTLTAVPAPSAGLDVTVAVAAAGDFGVSPGSRTVTIPTTGSADLTVATVGDSVDEADGSVSATVSSGAGYAVSATAGSASVAVADDDDPVCDAADAISRARSAFAWHADNGGGSETLFWQILAYLGADPLPAPPGGTAPASTTPEAVRTFSDGKSWPGWTPINAAMGCHVPPPEVSIAAGADIDEGGGATFTLTAVPAPSAGLDVTVAVAVAGDFGVSPGSRTVTIPTTGSADLTVATVGDSADEVDGSVTATVSAGAGYRVSAAAGTATVAVRDDDAAPVSVPEVSIAAGPGVVEGGDAVFAVSAVPAPSAPLAVDVTVAQSGDFGVATGSRQVTVSTSGSGTLSVSTVGDSVDEGDGSVTVAIVGGSGYSVSQALGSASVAVADDDDPVSAGDPCVAALSGDGSVAGVWAAGCGSSARAGRYARFYSFSLGAPGQVTIDLESSADTYMYLRTGVGQKSGAALVFNDDGGDGYDSRISRRLAAGGYTIEATTYHASTAGPFTLTVAGIPAPTAVQQDPEVSITAGAGIVEGGDAVFTVAADPAPSAGLDVTVAVAVAGDFGVSPGSRTVTVPASGTATFTVATVGDAADEADGSVTAAVSGGSGYTVSATAGAATVAVRDDDDAVSVCVASLPSDAVTVSEVTGWRDGHSGAAHVLRWNRVLAALGTDTGEAAMTVVQSRANEGQFMFSRWDRVTRTLEALEQCAGPPAAAPEVAITAGAGVTEGGDAVFTVTADPAPSAGLDVTVAVAAAGDFGVSPGPRTVTVPASGTATFTVATANDTADEADGSVTVTVGAGSGYTVSAANGSATVAVQDDDDPAPPPPPVDPEISITAGNSVTEGGDAAFTVTADPAPAAPLTVNVTVAQSGDFGVSPGTRTVTIPTSGTATLTVATTDDTTDEPDGSVTATLDAGTGYTVSATAGTAAVAIADDDNPPPPPPPPPPPASKPSISVDDATAAEGDGAVEFTVRLSAASTAAVTVYYAANPGTAMPYADYRPDWGQITFAPGDTSKTIQVSLIDDRTPGEGDETFVLKLILTDTTHATLADNQAQGTITDND